MNKAEHDELPKHPSDKHSVQTGIGTILFAKTVVMPKLDHTFEKLVKGEAEGDEAKIVGLLFHREHVMPLLGNRIHPPLRVG